MCTTGAADRAGVPRRWCSVYDRCCGQSRGATTVVQCVRPMLRTEQGCHDGGAVCTTAAADRAGMPRRWCSVYDRCCGQSRGATTVVQCVRPLLRTEQGCHDGGAVCTTAAADRAGVPRRWCSVYDRCCGQSGGATTVVQCVRPVLRAEQGCHDGGAVCTTAAAGRAGVPRRWCSVYGRCCGQSRGATTAVQCVRPLLWTEQGCHDGGAVCTAAAAGRAGVPRRRCSVYDRCCGQSRGAMTVVQCVRPVLRAERGATTAVQCVRPMLRAEQGCHDGGAVCTTGAAGRAGVPRQRCSVYDWCCGQSRGATTVVQCVRPLLRTEQGCHDGGAVCTTDAADRAGVPRRWCSVYDRCCGQSRDATTVVQCVRPMLRTEQGCHDGGAVCTTAAAGRAGVPRRWCSVYDRCCGQSRVATTVVQCVRPLLRAERGCHDGGAVCTAAAVDRAGVPRRRCSVYGRCCGQSRGATTVVQCVRPLLRAERGCHDGGAVCTTGAVDRAGVPRRWCSVYDRCCGQSGGATTAVQCVRPMLRAEQGCHDGGAVCTTGAAGRAGVPRQRCSVYDWCCGQSRGATTVVQCVRPVLRAQQGCHDGGAVCTTAAAGRAGVPRRWCSVYDRCCGQSGGATTVVQCVRPVLRAERGCHDGPVCECPSDWV